MKTTKDLGLGHMEVCDIDVQIVSWLKKRALKLIAGNANLLNREVEDTTALAAKLGINPELVPALRKLMLTLTILIYSSKETQKEVICEQRSYH